MFVGGGMSLLKLGAGIGVVTTGGLRPLVHCRAGGDVAGGWEGGVW